MKLRPCTLQSGRDTPHGSTRDHCPSSIVEGMGQAGEYDLFYNSVAQWTTENWQDKVEVAQ